MNRSAALERLYEEVKSGSAFVELKNRCVIRLTGSDRQSFFHNFCTNDIKQLGVDEVCEAFVLNSKGKILGYVHAVNCSDELLLIGHGDQAATIMQHLELYLIREDVAISDASKEFAALFVCGESPSESLSKCSPRWPSKNRCVEGQVGEAATIVINLEIAGFGYLLMCQRNDLASLKQSLLDAGLSEGTSEALNIVRVEQKTPWFGLDVDDLNLPQELQRDEQAISFNKGCYLGQETVARIDARGRVNQLLVGLTFLPETDPVVGTELVDGDSTVGRTTSVAFSYARNSPIGLGYVRRKYKTDGTTLDNAIVLS